MAAFKKFKEKEKSAQLAESSAVANGNIGELLECPITNEPMAREGVDESVPMITLCCGKTCSKGAATKVDRCPFCREEPLRTIENRLVEDIAKKYPEEKKAERARLHQITQQTKEKEKSLINSQKQELESLQNRLALVEERFQKSSKNEKKQEKEIARKDNALAEIQNQLNTSQQENLKLVAEFKDAHHQLTLSNQRQAELSATITQQTRWWRNPWLMFAAGVGGALLYTWHKATQPEEAAEQTRSSLDLLEPVLKIALAQLGQRFLPTINEVAQNLWQEQQHVQHLENFPPIHPPIYEPSSDLLNIQNKDKKEEPVPAKEYQPASLLPESKNINTILQNLCSDSLDTRNEAFNMLHFDADVRNLITSQSLQIVCDGGLYKGATIFHLIASTNAAILLEHKDFRDKVTSENLQMLATDGFCKGIPPLAYLMQDKTSILLKYKDLRDKITTKGLETFFTGDPFKGYSLFTYLLQRGEEAIKLLEDKDLRDKITPETLQATVPDGPYQGAPVVLVLVKEEERIELLLKYKDLRDKITATMLRTIAGEGGFEGASAIYWLLKSNIGRQVLLADNLRLFNLIDPTTFLTTYQFYNDDDKHKVGHWLNSFQEGRAFMIRVYSTTRTYHPPSTDTKSGFFSTGNQRPPETNNRPNVDEDHPVKH